MNDLEHDLRELFEQRASGVDVPGLPPVAILRRGRRRQVGTVVTGVLACIVALGVVAAAVDQARHPAVIPGRGNGLPARTTSIGGVPVTAPAGWTLVDDSPLAAVLATTSESCSFSGQGTPVEGNGSPDQGNTSSSAEAVPSPTPVTGGASEGGTSGSGQTCTTHNIGYPQGVPILQLANFEVPLTQTVCGLADQQPPATVPADGVAVYVGVFPGGVNTQAALDACPGSENVTGGDVLMTFADAGAQTAYAAVIVAGASADPSDVAVAQKYLDGLDGLRIDPIPPSSDSGPGYVMAAGTSGDTSWRLEAGLTSFARTPTLGASMITTTGSSEDVHTVDLPTDQRINDDAIDLGGNGGMVQFGTAAVDVAGVNVDTPTGDTVPATMLPWPTQIASSFGVRGEDGWIWFAQTPERGEVRASVASAPTSPPSPTDGTATERLQTTTDDQGRYTIFGNDLGHDWSFHQDQQDGAFLFYLDGVDQAHGEVLSLGAVTYLDIPGGTLALALEPASVTHLFVTSDVAGNDVIANGGWAPSSLGSEPNARVWVEALPGSGSGYAWSGNRLPIAIDWPTNPTVMPGDQIAAGSTPLVSWVEVWSDQGCPTFQVVAAVNDGDLGSSPCPIPWNAQEYANRTSYVGGVYGQQHATVWMLGPDGMMADATSPDDPNVGGDCGGSIANVGPWARTGACVFVIPVGQTYVIQPTLQDGTPLADKITITASPGRIKLGQSGSATATPTP